MTHFIKYKNELINLELCAVITAYDYNYVSYLIFSCGETVKSKLATFTFDTEKERDEYFLEIQERIEKIQGLKIDLGDKND